MSDSIFTTQKVRKTYMVKGRTQTTIFEKFSVDRGKINVLKGETGIGKTTLLNMLGLMDHIVFHQDDNITFFPTSTSHFHYRDIFSKGFFQKEQQLEEIRNNNFGFMFQQDHLIDAWTGWENVILPYLIRFPEKDKSEPKEIAKELIQSCQFDDMLDIMSRSPATYSGGQRQRAALIRAIIHKPKVIFADEPFASVPKRRARRILEILRDQARENGVTTIMVVHDIHDKVLKEALKEKDISILSLTKREYQDKTIISVKKGKIHEN